MTLPSRSHDQAMAESGIEHFRVLTATQAKGTLMARHSIAAGRAFEMLRDHSQHTGRKLADVAAVENHLLLLPPPTARPD